MAREVSRYRRITLQEYGEFVPLDVTQAEIDEITKYGNSWRASLKLRTDPFAIRKNADGKYEMRAEGIAGMARIGDIDFEIAPKFLDAQREDWQVAFWRILSITSGGLIDNRQMQANNSASQALVDLFAHAFMNSYARGALRGLPQGYKTANYSGTAPRGSLDLSQMNQMASRPWEYPCIVDSLTMDTPFASLIKWASDRLGKMVDSPSLARNLRYIAGTLSFVKTPVPHIVDARKLQLSAQYRGLEDALRIARMLLEGSGMSYVSGEKTLSGFLWNSDVVFENLMFWLCRQCAKHHGYKVSKHSYYFGEVVFGSGQRLKTIPDVVFKDGENKVVAIADAKYKSYSDHPVSSDVYQVLSDAHLLGTRVVALLYPVSTDTSQKTWRIESQLGGGSVFVTMLPVNLMAFARNGGSKELISHVASWLQRNVKNSQPE